MSNIIQLHPEPTLLERIGPAIALAAIAARDGTTEDQAEVMTALTMAIGRALAIMAGGSKQAAEMMLPIITQSIAEATAEGIGLCKIGDQLFGSDEPRTPPAGGAAFHAPLERRERTPEFDDSIGF